jgi:hypothetical protein
MAKSTVEGVLKLLELAGVLSREVVRLAEILVDVIELPLEVVRAGFITAGHPLSRVRARLGVW